jgi:hypothetical protein
MRSSQHLRSIHCGATAIYATVPLGFEVLLGLAERPQQVAEVRVQGIERGHPASASSRRTTRTGVYARL